MTDHQETINHFKDLPADFQGEFLRFGEEGYAKSRFIFNMRSEEARPALIARAACADDVAVLMRWASQRAIPVAIRGGGHSVDGSAMPDGALVLDLTALRRIDVDAATGRVRAEAGVLLVLCEIVGQWDGAAHDAAYVAWVDGLADALSPHMRRNGYSNLTTDRGPAWLRGLYGSESKYQRLIAAKTRWDPGNLLRFNKNLEPARRREDA